MALQVSRMIRKGTVWSTSRWMIAALALGSLGSCGGGGGTVEVGEQCRLSIASQPDGTGAGTDGGGPGPGSAGSSGGGGDGGAGLGQIRNATVTIEQANGEAAGPVALDNTTGLVRFVLCGYTGPVRFTVAAASNGTYFDEGAGVDVPFTGEIHAVIPTYTKNVGFTTLTEAAYQLVVTKYGADGWKDATHVTEANNAVREIFNRALPVGMQIDDITRLPQLVNSSSGANTLNGMQNGLLGTLNAGLAKAARFFNLGDPTPALTLARQLGSDLSDGKLDGFWQDAGGTARPIVGDSKDGTYTYAQFAEFLNNGVSQAAAEFGQTGSQAAALRFTQVKAVNAPGIPSDWITSKTSMFLLSSEGEVYFWPRPDQPLIKYASGFRQLFPLSSMLGSKTDGTVYHLPDLDYSDAQLALPFDQRIPDIVEPLVPAPDYHGATTIAMTPNTYSSMFGQISRLQDGIAYVDLREAPYLRGPGILASTGLASVVDVGAATMGAAGAAYFAVQSNGKVFAWGPGGSDCMALGLGLQADACPVDGRIALPTLNPALKDIVDVAGREAGGFAIDRSGKVWGWGAKTGSGLLAAAAAVPVEVSALKDFLPMAQIACGGFTQCIGMTATGDAIVWGYFARVEGSESWEEYSPTKINLPTGRRIIYVGGLDLSVYALLDDGTVMTFPTTPDRPLFLRPPDPSQAPSRSYTVGGTIAGLTASGLVLANGTDSISVAANATNFVLPAALTPDASYSVVVESQPTGLACSVANGGGTMGIGNLTSVTVLCFPSGVSETLLYSFGELSACKSCDGGLVQAADGNLYGLTSGGGGTGAGTMFRITPSGAYSLLHSFGAAGDGDRPIGPLIQASDGNFYGVSVLGGTNDKGTVFRGTTDGAVTVLHSFGSVAGDGEHPLGPLVYASDGNLYGVTYAGGANNQGTVFRVTTTGVRTTLYSCSGAADCGTPQRGLVQGSDGYLYGTSERGGDGAVFRVTTSGALSVLYAFHVRDSWPLSLVEASDGDFYGTTPGTVFKLTKFGVLTTLHSFVGGGGGATPTGALIQARDGYLYGMTAGGGVGRGTVFRISTRGDEVNLVHAFGIGAADDGAEPGDTLIQGSDGSMYGVTHRGGSNDLGAVFKITIN